MPISSFIKQVILIRLHLQNLTNDLITLVKIKSALVRPNAKFLEINILKFNFNHPEKRYKVQSTSNEV